MSLYFILKSLLLQVQKQYLKFAAPDKNYNPPDLKGTPGHRNKLIFIVNDE